MSRLLLCRVARSAAACLVLVGGLCAAGCQDPCVALAERVCNCEKTTIERRACREDRITSQQGQIEITDQDKSRCTAALDTCTCNSLDENRLGECGFVPVAGDAP